MRDGSPWKNIDLFGEFGSEPQDCNWFARGPKVGGQSRRCLESPAHKPNSEGVTASQACCVCGGGDKPSEDAMEPWHDGSAEQHSCYWYSLDPDKRCSLSFPFVDLNASIACCCCGGGAVSVKAKHQPLPSQSMDMAGPLIVAMIIVFACVWNCSLCICTFDGSSSAGSSSSGTANGANGALSLGSRVKTLWSVERVEMAAGTMARLLWCCPAPE